MATTRQIEGEDQPCEFCVLGSSATACNHHGKLPPTSPMASLDSNASAKGMYLCTLCPQRFDRLHNLKSHMLVHTGEGPFICEVPSCGRRFYVMDNLRRHGRVHQDDRVGNDNDGSSSKLFEAESLPSDHNGLDCVPYQQGNFKQTDMVLTEEHQNALAHGERYTWGRNIWTTGLAKHPAVKTEPVESRSRTKSPAMVNKEAKDLRHTVRKHVMREYRRRERPEQELQQTANEPTLSVLRKANIYSELAALAEKRDYRIISGKYEDHDESFPGNETQDQQAESLKTTNSSGNALLPTDIGGPRDAKTQRAAEHAAEIALEKFHQGNLSSSTLVTKQSPLNWDGSEDHEHANREARRKRPSSQKATLAEALRRANDAVGLDNAQKYEQALVAYAHTCDLLTQVIDGTKGDKDRKKIEAIISTYQTRRKELEDDCAENDRQPYSEPKTALHDHPRSISPLSASSKPPPQSDYPKFSVETPWDIETLPILQPSSVAPFTEQLKRMPAKSSSYGPNSSTDRGSGPIKPVHQSVAVDAWTSRTPLPVFAPRPPPPETKSQSSQTDWESLEHPVPHETSPSSIHPSESRNDNDSMESCDSLMSEMSLNEKPNAVSQIFVIELANRVVAKALGTSESGSKKCQGAHEESSSSSDQSSLVETPSNSQTPSGKRRRERDEWEGEDERDGEKNCPPSKPKQQKRDHNDVRLFACPYTKFNPERYSGQNHAESYRTCSTLKLTTISRVKQHLERTHKRPDFYCGRCYESFEERDSLNDHHRADPRCGKKSIAKYDEMMSDHQWATVKSQRLENSSKSWYKIFRILFKDVPDPSSPYVSLCNAEELQKFAQFFCWVGPEEILGLVRDRLEQNNAPLDINTSLANLIVESFEHALPQYEQRLEQLRSQFQSSDRVVEVSQVPMSDQASTITLDCNPRGEINDSNGLNTAGASDMADNENSLFEPERVAQEFEAFWNELCEADDISDDWILAP